MLRVLFRLTTPHRFVMFHHQNSLFHLRQHHWLALALLGGLLLCTGVSAAQNKAQARLERLYLLRQGYVWGCRVALKTKVPMRLLLDRNQRLQWVQIRRPDVTLRITPTGQLLLEEIKAKASLTVSYDPQGRFAQFGSTKVRYDKNGRLASINDVSVTYDLRGRLKRVQGATLKYRNDGRLAQIAQLTLNYGLNGRLSTLGALTFKYQAVGRLAAIGKQRYRYHPLLSSIVAITGSNTGFRTQIFWDKRLLPYRSLQR